jgi:hypothetical protein
MVVWMKDCHCFDRPFCTFVIVKSESVSSLAFENQTNDVISQWCPQILVRRFKIDLFAEMCDKREKEHFHYGLTVPSFTFVRKNSGFSFCSNANNSVIVGRTEAKNDYEKLKPIGTSRDIG